MADLMHNPDEHPDFYVPNTAYKPGMIYHEHVAKMLPRMWRLNQGHFWTQALSPKPMHPVQGWKIHVSALPSTALATLDKVAPLCIARNVEFKFASDRRILGSLLRKNTARQSGGKFITIYPTSQAVFEELIEALYAVLKDETGPYILSDRQYRDAQVLFYRYGGFHSFHEKNVTGETKLNILNGQYGYIEDIRAPYFALPDFVTDRFQPAATSPATGRNQSDRSPAAGSETGNDSGAGDSAPADGGLEQAGEKKQPIFGGKYAIEGVIKYSNQGGVYLAKNILDQTDVIIKEARPHVEISDKGGEGIDRLRKEFRMLKQLSGTHVAPEGFDLFEEWNHVFLAQQHLKGQNYRQYMVATNKLLHPTTSDSVMREWFAGAVTVARQLVEKVITLHSHNIIFGDLSLNNVIIEPSTMQIWLIDFEGAYEPGVDHFTNMYTPGFAPRTRASKATIDVGDDYYGLGCFLLSICVPNITLIEIKEDFARVSMAELQKDIGLPQLFIDVVNNLLSDQADLAQCLEKLQQINPDEVHGFRLDAVDVAAMRSWGQQVVKGVVDYNLSVMDVTLPDRVFPAGPELDDPLALNHGMLGVAWAMQKVSGSIPQELDSWIRQQFRTESRLPGLLNGWSGVAWALTDMGHDKQALKALQLAGGHRLLFQKMGLGYGAAGYGMANLYLHQQTGQASCLNEAINIADIICDNAMPHEAGLVWDDPEAGVDVGLWQGGSGIALFLLYMYCSTRNPRYLQSGEQALRTDMFFGREIEGTLGFPEHTVKSGGILYPYLGHGSAGVATVALRYYLITHHPDYLALVEKSKGAVTQKYTIGPALFSGLAGLGNYMLDAAQLLGDNSYRDLAYRLLEGLKLFALERNGGITFPLWTPTKICSDYAAGSAGIALFVHRLVTDGSNFNFTMDELIHNVINPAQELKVANG